MPDHDFSSLNPDSQLAIADAYESLARKIRENVAMRGGPVTIAIQLPSAFPGELTRARDVEHDQKLSADILTLSAAYTKVAA